MSEKPYKREYKLKALQCKIEKELRDLRCLQRAHEEEERYKAHGLVKDLLPSTQKHPQHDGVTSFYAKYKQGYRKGGYIPGETYEFMHLRTEPESHYIYIYPTRGAVGVSCGELKYWDLQFFLREFQHMEGKAKDILRDRKYAFKRATEYALETGMPSYMHYYPNGGQEIHKSGNVSTINGISYMVVYPDGSRIDSFYGEDLIKKSGKAK